MPTKSQKELLLKAVNAFGERFIVVSPKFEILSTSPSTSEFLQDTIIGKNCFDVIYNRSSPCKNCTVKEAMARDEPSSLPKQDEVFDVGSTLCRYAYPLYKDSQIEAFAIVEFDLPIRQGLEDALQRSNTFLRKLLVSAVDAVIAADKKGRILIYNEMAAKILGYDADKAPQEIEIVDLYPNDTAYEVMKKMRSDDFGGKGNLRSYHVDVIAKNGEIIPIRLNAAIVYDGKQEIATIGYFHDMREELKMKEELKKTQIQLLQAERLASIGMLATGVAHEINNPVAIMIEESGWIEDLFDEEEFQSSKNLKEFIRALKQIKTQGNRCKEITRKLLSFAQKIDSGVQTTQLNDIIEEVVSLSVHRAKHAGVELKTSLQKDLPFTLISASEMQQVLLNLINNSLDAMENTGGTITLSSCIAHGQIMMEIVDDGPGIPVTDQSRIFDPFFTTKPVGKGTGLGLFICYSIIKSMGGKIDVKSDLGAGTNFSISIPVQDEALTELE